VKENTTGLAVRSNEVELLLLELELESELVLVLLVLSSFALAPMATRHNSHKLLGSIVAIVAVQNRTNRGRKRPAAGRPGGKRVVSYSTYASNDTSKRGGGLWLVTARGWVVKSGALPQQTFASAPVGTECTADAATIRARLGPTLSASA
jgi:hypothetical protein